MQFNLNGSVQNPESLPDKPEGIKSRNAGKYNSNWTSKEKVHGITEEK